MQTIREYIGKVQAVTQEPSKGLGDTVAKVTRVMGVTPCTPCQKRREMLNKMVPYKQAEEKK